MNLLVMKLGMKYVPNQDEKHVAIGEVDSVVNMFKKNGHSVTILTDNYYDQFEGTNFINVNKINDISKLEYDALYVFNGYFPEGLNDYNLLQYNIINGFTRNVVYLYFDMTLPLKTFTLTRTDIMCLCQGKNIETVSKSLLSNSDTYSFQSDRIKYFPLQRFPLTMIDSDKFPLKNEKKYDLKYGGSFRFDKRTESLKKWYFNLPDDISSCMFGSVIESIDQFKSEDMLRFPDLKGKVHYNKFMNEMSDSLATVYIADDKYVEFDAITQRIYECFLAGCFVFVDESCDPGHRIYGNVLFPYVKTKTELIRKIRMIRLKNSFDQYKDTYVSAILRNKSISDNATDLLKLLEYKMIEIQTF